MNNLTERRETSGTQLTEPEMASLNAILASCRAWILFQEHAHILNRMVADEKENISVHELSAVENRTQVWLEMVKAAESAGVLDSSYRFFLRTYAVESVHEQRIIERVYETDLADINVRMNAIQKREGLDDHEFWPIGEGPEDWEKLSDEYSQVLDEKFEEALREFNLNSMADTYRTNREGYDEIREQGRRATIDDISELEELSDSQKLFEAEAVNCAKNGAYIGAAVMIGSAIEAALLFACLNRRKEALSARGRLPNSKRPNSGNPTKWRFYELVEVAAAAGWLPDFKVMDGILRSHPLVDMMRQLRNLVHPSRYISKKISTDVESQYASAYAAYILLRRHLIEPRADS